MLAAGVIPFAGDDDVALIHGDARRLDEYVPAGSVDLIVTSPPYFGLRDYDGADDREIGREATPEEFVEALLVCTASWARALSPAGSMFVNLGDRYLPNDGLSMVPWRYAIGCVDRLGLHLRAEIVWHKPNAIPDPNPNRVERHHETWLHLTREASGYYARLDAIRTEHRTEQRDFEGRVGPSGENRGRSTRKRDDGRLPGNFRRSAKGRLPGSVWSVPTAAPDAARVRRATGVSHTAMFPEVWPWRLIRAWSPIGGLVVDPFSGSGTTVAVARRLGRRAVGVDCSEVYLGASVARVWGMD